ncbi:MAG: RNA ligase partner protein [Candidatus Omnitrophica bacterium]|nr:RNA ligase partner protein [Candidatus Omnitrophota bacterium]MCM8826822.1 RNA ligase partner protein [Candidatus Omnitrophota bacterium]
MDKERIKVVLDTNIFVNPDSRIILGETPQQALNNFLELLSKKNNIKCFMPPSIYEELTKFIDTQAISKIILINRKPPSKYEINIPSLLFYEFVEEMRNRINKGLRVGEKYVHKALLSDKEEELIKSLREEYRLALREGIIDSKEDVDLLILAKELSAYLATSDNGLIFWADKLGISCISTQELKTIIE